MTEKETTTATTTTMVEMTPEEKQRFEAFKLEEAKRKKREEQEANLNAYRELVDETVDKVVTQFTLMSEQLRSTKNSAIRSLMDLVKMKRETLGLKADGQWSYTFTKPDSKRRVTMGVHTLDGWQDTVEEGIEMVTEYIKGLASDDNSQALVGMVLKLLAKDASGNLNADKVLELRRIAEESGSEQFIDGVRLIEDSHFKTVSKIFLKAEVRNDIGVWERLPLNITEVATDAEAQQLLLDVIDKKQEERAEVDVIDND